MNVSCGAADSACAPSVFPLPLTPAPHPPPHPQTKPPGHLGKGGSAYVLGDMFHGLQWHVYVADAHGAGAAYEPPSGKPFHKFEVRAVTRLCSVTCACAAADACCLKCRGLAGWA